MKKKLFIIIAFIVFAILYALLPIPSFAQDTAAYSVFPAVQDIKVTPGVKTRAQVQFRNNSDSLAIGTVKVADFIITDKKGTTQIIEDSTLKPTYSASSWITLSDTTNVAIPARQSVLITMYITPPPVLTSCGYYAMVYYEPNPAAIKRLGTGQEAATSVTTKIGALLNFVAQGRQCNENMSFSQVNFPSFLEYGPIPLSIDLANNGDIHLSPTGYATLTNLFGSYVDQQNLPDRRIFPGKIKNYELSLGHKWMFGRYKITLLASYGSNNQRLTDTVYVWVLPWRVMLVVLLTLVILFVLGRNFYTKLMKKESVLEEEITEEKAEIEKLREALKKRKD